MVSFKKSSLLFALVLPACLKLEGEHPKKDYERVQAIIAKEKEAKAAASSGDPHAAAKENYTTYCVSCHGADGKAAGPVAQAMNPKPRNLTLASWQDSVNDEHIYKVIDKGGAAVGLAATMAPWGALLNKEQIDGLVAYIRSMKE